MAFGDATHPFELDRRAEARVDVVLSVLRRYHRHAVVGLDAIPEPPFILAANHSLATYDLALLGHTLLRERGILVRGLGDRLIFKLPMIDEMAHRAGVVEGRPENAEALLRDGEALMVAPGGMMEALRPSRNRYEIWWKQRKGFVRLAIRTGVPIVLAACPRADDLYTVLRAKVTHRAYSRFRLPLPLPFGRLGTLVPRRVPLRHHIAGPFHPPPFDERTFEHDVEALHTEIVDAMEELIDVALLAPRPSGR